MVMVMVTSWARQLSSHLLLASTLFSLPYLSFCFSPFLSFSIYWLLLLFPFSFISCYFISVPLLSFLYYTDTSSLSLFKLAQYSETTSPISISVLWNSSLFSTPSSLTFSPVLQSALLCFLLSPSSALDNFAVDYHWTTTFTPSSWLC
jgi:hypothetical protein